MVSTIKLRAVLLVDSPRIGSGIRTFSTSRTYRWLGYHKGRHDIGQDSGESGKDQSHKDDSDDYRIHIEVFTDSSADAEEYFIVLRSI